MKRLGLVAAFLLLGGATSSDCQSTPASRAQEKLGGSAACTSTGNYVAFCVRDGVRYECVAPPQQEAQCGIVTSPDAER